MDVSRVASGLSRSRSLILGAALLMTVTGAAALIWTFTAAGSVPAFATGAIPADHILLPKGPVRSVVMLFSGIAGWDQTDQALADKLVTRKAAVVGVDLTRYLANLAQKAEDCHYLISDIESLSHQIQRATGGADYRPPILAGKDVGRWTGARPAGPDSCGDDRIDSGDRSHCCRSARQSLMHCRHSYRKRKWCRLYPSDRYLADPVTVLLSPAASAPSRARAETFAADASGAEVSDGSGSAAALLGATLSAEVDKLASAPKTPAVRVTATSTI